jgi:RimJ/RimL family protein N-acetyltransferase
MSEVFDLQPILEGALLRLRPLRPEDWDDLFAVASDPLIWEQHPIRDRYTEKVFQVLFREALESRGALIAIDSTDGHVIGSSRFHGYDKVKSEKHAFRFVTSVIFLVGSQNVRSQRAVEKIGAVRAGSGPRRDGTGQDSFVYRIFAPHSPSAKD